MALGSELWLLRNAEQLAAGPAEAGVFHECSAGGRCEMGPSWRCDQRARCTSGGRRSVPTTPHLHRWQECVLEKAIADKKAPGVVARLAKQVGRCRALAAAPTLLPSSACSEASVPRHARPPTASPF